MFTEFSQPSFAAPLQGLLIEETLKRVSVGEKNKLFNEPLLHLPNSLRLRDLDHESFLTKVVEPSLLKLIRAANPQGASIFPELTVAAGGWCSFFTGDFNLISHGILPDPLTGEGKTITSVEQVTNWIAKAIRLDQIVEAIFPLNAQTHLGIEEVALWSEKLSLKLELFFGRKLSGQERNLIFESITKAARLRKTFTDNFLRVTSKVPNISVTQFTDQEIWIELNQTRDELFSLAGINDFQTADLQTEGLLWMQYTQPYVQVLQQAGLIPNNTECVIFSEPINHASPFIPNDPALSKAVKQFFTVVFDGENVFWGENSLNRNVGQLAMLPCFGIRSKINPATNLPLKDSQRVINTIKGSRQQLTVADVPNNTNWQDFLDSLDPNEISSMLCDSNLFLWSVNLLCGFNDSLSLLLEIIGIFHEDPNTVQAKQRIRNIQHELKQLLTGVITTTFSK